MRLSQSGISKERRFSFYDQVHTTGMDIKQHYTAVAVVTLGKDMTFRDYAQVRAVCSTSLCVPKLMTCPRERSECAALARDSVFVCLLSPRWRVSLVKAYRVAVA